MTRDASIESLATLVKVAGDPLAYAARWKSATGRKVVGCLPMNFPLELIDAAGALPLLLQEGAEAITTKWWEKGPSNMVSVNGVQELVDALVRLFFLPLV